MVMVVLEKFEGTGEAAAMTEIREKCHCWLE